MADAGYFYTATMTGLESGKMYDYMVGAKTPGAFRQHH